MDDTGVAAEGQSRLPPVFFSIALFCICFWMNFSVEAGDFREFRTWLIHIADVGPVSALATPFSGYSPPYLYALTLASPAVGWIMPGALIKWVSCAGYLMFVFAIRHLMIVVGQRDANRSAALFALVPTLFGNFAIMNQCDAFWGAAVTMATAAAIRRNHASMFLWFGFGVAFKLQAAFAGPFFLAIAIAQGAPLRKWLMAPLAVILAYLPAWIAGWPLRDLLTVYFKQAGFFRDLSLGAPNIWGIIQWMSPDPSLQWLAFPGTIVAIIACIAFVPWSQRYLRDATPELILRMAVVGGMLAPSLLPRMHERYFFMVDAFALVLGLLDMRRYGRLTLLVQVGTTLALLCYVTQNNAFAAIGAVPMLGGLWVAGRVRPVVTGNYTDRRPPSPAPSRSIPVGPAIHG